MVDRASIKEQFAANLRKAEVAARAMSESVSSIDDTVVRTRLLIDESHRLMAQADKLLSR